MFVDLRGAEQDRRHIEATHDNGRPPRALTNAREATGRVQIPRLSDRGDDHSEWKATQLIAEETEQTLSNLGWIDV